MRFQLGKIRFQRRDFSFFAPGRQILQRPDMQVRLVIVEIPFVGRQQKIIRTLLVAPVGIGQIQVIPGRILFGERYTFRDQTVKE